MKPFFYLLSLIFALSLDCSLGQTPAVNKKAFFTDTSILNATLVTNLSKLVYKHGTKPVQIPGQFKTTLADGTPINDPVLLEIRGHMRLDYCFVPPIRIFFDHTAGAFFHSLKTLKLVNECKISFGYDQYVLKEFTIYKIYNLLTDKSFRVRLLNLQIQDSAGRKKTITEHAFLLEDIKEVAKRNDCKEWKKPNVKTEGTNRRQMTLVAIFQYMIGNTDWAVTVNHNIRLIVSNKDSLARPDPIPYDFDYSGLVNTEYAVPSEQLNIENVTQRIYRGYPRTMMELDEVLNIFKQQKDSIYHLINHFDLLTPKSKRDITDYLDDFYEMIGHLNLVKLNFIDKARTE